MKAIQNAIRPMVDGRPCSNIFIHGPSGTGKTTCMKIALGQLKNDTSKVIPVYVNCWEHPTQMAVYYQICDALEIILPRRGLGLEEVFSKINEHMRIENVRVLIVLDEMDSNIFKGEDTVLYVLSQNHTNFGIIGISNKAEIPLLLDERISTRLQFNHMEFGEYSKEQLCEIAAQRAKLALGTGTHTPEVIRKCAEIGSECKGGARLTLELLWKAANRAEDRGVKIIEVADVLDVSKTIQKRPSGRRTYRAVSFEDYDLKVSDEEMIILAALGEGEKTSSQLYDAFMAKIEKSKRQIRNYLMIMEAKGLVDSKEVDYRDNSFLRIKVYALRKRLGDLDGLRDSGCGKAIS